MVKELPEDHPMRMFGASHWCKYDYPKDMSFVEFLEILELISSVDGAEWEEVQIKKDYHSTPSRQVISKLPTKGLDWYWCWSVADRIDRDQIDVFLTTEKQATYFSMANTAKFPSDKDTANDILNQIRARKNTNSLGPAPGRDRNARIVGGCR